ncbi:hypothetical protein LO772_05140 [Yinghuangia sp. ASG 101]|uniref:hypothetical protein n=1 Tax=Yinghuangia sp. ASG 101 TaxID=2896848 RepID=UPI001E56F934|nr:hypothetical protein [Yinghuangia sp. ASG 101]UGQ13010.1 hypothetical protein LO772_05140 [Yinghuangia sp. ASG 101]
MYDPFGELERLGVHVRRASLRAAWAVWVPHKRAIVLTTGLSRVEERCVLAHHVEHILADDRCPVGGVPVPAAPDRHRGLRDPRGLDPGAALREHLADRAAAAKLVDAGTARRTLARTENPVQAAELLDITAHMLAVRLARQDGVDHRPAPHAPTMGS